MTQTSKTKIFACIAAFLLAILLSAAFSKTAIPTVHGNYSFTIHDNIWNEFRKFDNAGRSVYTDDYCGNWVDEIYVDGQEQAEKVYYYGIVESAYEQRVKALEAKYNYPQVVFVARKYSINHLMEISATIWKWVYKDYNRASEELMLEWLVNGVENLDTSKYPEYFGETNESNSPIAKYGLAGTSINERNNNLTIYIDIEDEEKEEKAARLYSEIINELAIPEDAFDIQFRERFVLFTGGVRTALFERNLFELYIIIPVCILGAAAIAVLTVVLIKKHSKKKKYLSNNEAPTKLTVSPQ
ncbi:MAG: hypothetical protein FWH03_05170 [Firmicutes bacterium]|nr:hypothetical protein [Bacillota bacterium]